MKTTLYLITIVCTTILMIALCASCTHNGGDIGLWFGTWHIQSITADGVSVSTEGDYFLQFQSSVVRISLVGDYEQTTESFGTWQASEDNDALTISFPDPEVYYLYIPGFGTDNHFAVHRSGGDQLTLSTTTTQGASYTYHLKKQP